MAPTIRLPGDPQRSKLQILREPQQPWSSEPYDAELERSARYLFTFCGGVGPGAVGCQGVESLGHILKVLAHHSGYDPEKFMLKLAEQHEFRFAEHHGVLELLSSSDACEEDVGEETEESQSKKGTRKRAHS